MGAITAAAGKVGISLDKEIRLACVDEDYLAPYGPAFLHVKQDEAAIAEKAVEVLLGRIAGGRGEEEILVESKRNNKHQSVQTSTIITERSLYI